MSFEQTIEQNRKETYVEWILDQIYYKLHQLENVERNISIVLSSNAVHVVNKCHCKW